VKNVRRLLILAQRPFLLRLVTSLVFVLRGFQAADGDRGARMAIEPPIETVLQIIG
jgi:hypothetical protein